jgi:hypothetical protein
MKSFEIKIEEINLNKEKIEINQKLNITVLKKYRLSPSKIIIVSRNKL